MALTDAGSPARGATSEDALREHLAAAKTYLERTLHLALDQVSTYRALFEAIPDPYLATDRQGRIRHANRSAEALLGIPAEDLVGMPLARLSTVHSGDAIERLLREAPGAAGGCEGEVLFLRAGAAALRVTARVAPLAGAESEVNGLAWLLRDPARADAAPHIPLSEPAGGAQDVVDTLREPLLTLDGDLRVESANRAFYATFRVTAAEVLGLPLHALGDGQWDIPKLRSTLEEILRVGGTAEDVQVDHDFPHIGRRVMVLNARRLSDDATGAHRLLLAIEDATTRIEGERTMRRLNRQLNAANEELTTFAYSVSHDLRAPLRTLDGFSMALLEDYGEVLDEHGRDYLGRLRAAAQRMGGLIDALLQLSRITRTEPQRQQVDLSAMAGEIAAALAAGAPERQVALDIQPGLTAYGDPRLLRAALENLLGNAWKFTSRRSEARIAFGQEPWEGKMVYYVRDNGAGFDMAYAHKLFGAFQRLHGQEEFEGHGIGLATVQRIVRLHGGDVWAEGAVERGATFRFTLEDRDPAGG